jgi:hypothetical protein
MSKKRRIDICVACGEENEIAAFGYCFKCYRQRERAFDAKQPWDPGEKSRRKMEQAYSAIHKALVVQCGLTHERAHQLITMVSSYVKSLADFLGEKKVELEELIEGEAGEALPFPDTEPDVKVNEDDRSRSDGGEPGEAEGPERVNVNKQGSSRSHPEEEDFTDLTEETEAEVSVNAAESSLSEPEPAGPASVNVNREQSSHSPKDPRYFTNLEERTRNKKESSAVETEKAKAAILAMLSRDRVRFVRLEDFFIDPFLATISDRKLREILNEGVREGKWGRTVQATGATWHRNESGARVNAEQSSHSQREIPKAEKPSTESDAKAKAAKG